MFTGHLTCMDARLSLAANYPPELVLSFMLSAWLPWIAAAVVLIVLPVALRLWASDDPRSDEPPDTDGGEPVSVLLAA